MPEGCVMHPTSLTIVGGEWVHNWRLTRDGLPMYWPGAAIIPKGSGTNLPNLRSWRAWWVRKRGSIPCVLHANCDHCATRASTPTVTHYILLPSIYLLFHSSCVCVFNKEGRWFRSDYTCKDEIFLVTLNKSWSENPAVQRTSKKMKVIYLTWIRARMHLCVGEWVWPDEGISYILTHIHHSRNQFPCKTLRAMCCAPITTVAA